ncbi:MAG: RNA-splicing ligase RtcB [Candidatus Aminicenantes bacterium]|nr:MAG: RNA-splicing ligase RtcB [Candidatus Aminicenantes bacterium]
MDLKKINEFLWEIPPWGKMKVPARIYASASLLESVQRDRTLEQAQNVATLPGIIQASYVMPDAHQGYGFPIGGVAAFDEKEGIISPGGVGYDINCGVRLLKTEYSGSDLKPRLAALMSGIFQEVPAGVGKGRKTKLGMAVLDEVLNRGAEWAVDSGFGSGDDLQRTEEYGRMKEANPEVVSQRAKERGLSQLGTLGAGNHFLELQQVEEIYNQPVAKRFGLHSVGQVTIMIHCGSRGLGHQMASDYIRMMEDTFGTKHLVDRELVYAPLQSSLGKRYYQAMCAAVNFAFANRQMITHWVREVFKRILGSSQGIEMIYDVCHNVAKFENHLLDQQKRRVCVHRKGATRSFGPGRPEIPDCYRDVGQPVIIPGSMGTASYLLVGTNEAEKLSFSSTAHGAGRVMSRHEALRRFRGEEIKRNLEKRGIILKSTSWKSVAEEASAAYKDVDEVVRTSDAVGLGKLVAKFSPLGVMKG